MRQIWKYPLALVDKQTIQMPTGAEVLSVQLQEGVPYMWVLVGPEPERVERIFHVYGTGHPIPNYISKRMFIGTWQYPGLVFHLFEEL